MLAEGSTVIGPEGGVLDIPFKWRKWEKQNEETQHFNIEFPAGAVTEPTEVSAEIWREQIRGVNPVSPVVHLKPAGFQSEKRLQVVLPITRWLDATPFDTVVMLHRSTQTDGAIEAVGFTEHSSPDGLSAHIHNFSELVATSRNRLGSSRCPIGHGIFPEVSALRLNLDACKLFTEDTSVGVEAGISEWGSATLDDCRQPLTSLAITTNQITDFVQLERITIEPIRNVWETQILSWDFRGGDMNVIPPEDYGDAAFETRRFDANMAFPEARVPFWRFGPMGFEVWPEDDKECLAYRALIDVKPLGGITTTVPITYDSCDRFAACSDAPDAGVEDDADVVPTGCVASWTVLEPQSSTPLQLSSTTCGWDVDQGILYLAVGLADKAVSLTIPYSGPGSFDFSVGSGNRAVVYTPTTGPTNGYRTPSSPIPGITVSGTVTINESGTTKSGTFEFELPADYNGGVTTMQVIDGTFRGVPMR